MTNYMIVVTSGKGRTEFEYKTFGRASNKFHSLIGRGITNQLEFEKCYAKDGSRVEYFPKIDLDSIPDDISDLVLDSVIESPVEEATLVEPKIRRVVDTEYQVDHYVKCKSASGNSSLDNGDITALQLRGQPLDEVYKIAAEITNRPEPELRNRYAHLNVGMQRMNLGNIIRSA